MYKISIETVLEEGITDGMIDRGLVPYVKRVLEQAEWADAVILEINTHGGRVDSAVKILDDVRDAEVRTIAFIRRAISAGALWSPTPSAPMSSLPSAAALMPSRTFATTALPRRRRILTGLNTAMQPKVPSPRCARRMATRNRST